jgi:hypothetical protein
MAEIVVPSLKDDLEAMKNLALKDVENVELHASLAVVYACRAGGRFLVMKELVEGARGYGNWGAWLQGNVSLSPRSVNVYMQLAKTIPALADPTLDAETAMNDPAVRELAGLSVRKALLMLAEKAGTTGSRTRRKKGESEAAEEGGGEGQPEGRVVPPEAFAPPIQVLNGWVRGHLPLATDEQRADIIAEYMKYRTEVPPDGEVFELACVMWTLGLRAKPGRPPSRSRARGSLKALPDGGKESDDSD